MLKIARIVKVSRLLRPVGPALMFSVCRTENFRGFFMDAKHRCCSYASALQISECISGLSLSWPVQIIGLLGIYPNNNLICRSPILTCRSFWWRGIPAIITYGVLCTVSRDYPPRKGRLTTCYWAVRQALRLRLAWLSRILIAVVSGGINQNCWVCTFPCVDISPDHASIWHNNIYHAFTLYRNWNCQKLRFVKRRLLEVRLLFSIVTNNQRKIYRHWLLSYENSIF